MKVKVQTRKQVLTIRDTLTIYERISMSEKATELLLGFEPFVIAETTMFFISFRSEILTELMIRRSLGAGKRVVVPVTNIEERTLTASLLLDYNSELAPGAFGIPEPMEGCVRPVPPEEIDFIALPGAAFDRRGNRVGYGGGFYDRFTEKRRPDVPLVALAFSCQVIDSVPTEPHDRPVDYIITEKEIIECS
ncbi:5-formyltetrahydrofolate cyclo-ligase [bacterium]